MFGNLFITGIVIGLMVSMPLGPIALLIIQKTVNKNRLSGFISGVGVALSDTFYAIIAGFSLTYIVNILKEHQLLFQIFGALALIGLGLNIFFKNPVKEVRKFRKKGSSYYQDLIFSFLITISNPLVILIFIAVLTGSGIVLSISEPYHSFFIVAGIFTGGCLWWLLLTTIVSFFKHKFNLRILWWFNKIAGITIIVFVLLTVIYAILTKATF